MVHENTFVSLDNLEFQYPVFSGAAFILTFQTSMTTH